MYDSVDAMGIEELMFFKCIQEYLKINLKYISNTPLCYTHVKRNSKNKYRIIEKYSYIFIIKYEDKCKNICLYIL